MKKKTIIFSLLSLSLLVSGAGTHYMMKKEGKEVSHDAQSIAIINLDEGISYNGKERFFAKEFLTKYNDIYVVTGLGEAKDGLSKGKYCAYMIIPADFSKNTVSINNNPKKSLLRYELANDMSTQNMQYALSLIMELKDSLSKSMSYLYVYDIFHELHQGQDSALQVLKNERLVQDSLQHIQSHELLTVLEIEEQEPMQTPQHSWEIQSFVEGNNQLIHNIEQAYQEYLTSSQEQLFSLQNEYQGMQEEYQEIVHYLKKFQPLILSDGIPNYQLHQTETYINQCMTEMYQQCETMIDECLDKELKTSQVLKECQEEIYSLVEQVVNRYQHVFIQKMLDCFHSQLESLSLEETFSHVYQFLENYNDNQWAYSYVQQTLLNAIYQYDYTHQTNKELVLQDIETSLMQDEKFVNAFETYKELFDSEDWTMKDVIENQDIYQFNIEVLNEKMQLDIAVLYENISRTFEDEMEKYLNGSINQDIQSYVDEYVTKLKTISVFSSDDLKEMLMDLKVVQSEDICNTVQNDLENLDILQKEVYEQLNTLLLQYQKQGQLYMQEFLLYDPLQYIQKEQIDDYQLEMVKTYMQLKLLVEENDKNYTQFVKDCYEKANQTIEKLYQSLMNYQQQSDLQISQALENAKTTQQNYFDMNNEMMNQFIHQLSETRNGTLANEMVYDFIVSPITLEEK